ncbi:hypothetical protein I5I61_25390 [Pseudomonas nitroreducens]|uniref:Uncharacterized protein n=1 Tax=Pseudomonas nitroreducens TaxID=46680 RepID=A0ABS0KTC1_PSENT|nr:hypothetical protein [Pseudomonas nitroreducens]MBG6290806.1 hypothetical protein [Pseudomonas nitroreducens]
MANLGNVGQAVKSAPPSATQFTLWASWPEVGTAASVALHRSTGNYFTTAPKAPGRAAAIPASGTVSLTQNGFPVDQQGGTGTVYFYDLDDGTYFATQADTGKVWRVDVAGATVTVTPVGGGSAPTTHAAAFVMA